MIKEYAGCYTVPEGEITEPTPEQTEEFQRIIVAVRAAAEHTVRAILAELKIDKGFRRILHIATHSRKVRTCRKNFRRVLDAMEEVMKHG